MKSGFVAAVLVLGLLASPGALHARSKKVLMNFEGTPLSRVIKWMSQKTGKNFILEDALRDHRITVISGSRVTLEEAYDAFIAVLDVEGLHVVEEGRFYKITSGKRGSRRGSRADISIGDCPFPSGIREVNDTTWSVQQSEFDKWMDNLNCLAIQARIVPHLVEGKPEGFKLFAIRPNSFYSKLGLQNGDVILKINGIALSSPDNALEAYTKLRDAKELTLDILRRGKARKHTYRFE